jgi:hypothetical protein
MSSNIPSSSSWLARIYSVAQSTRCPSWCGCFPIWKIPPPPPVARGPTRAKLGSGSPSSLDKIVHISKMKLDVQPSNFHRSQVDYSVRCWYIACYITHLADIEVFSGSDVFEERRFN